MQLLSALSKLLLVSSITSFGASALAQQQFGSAGFDGRPGQDGRDGRSGQPLVITTQGAPVSYNIAGEDGSSGTNGQDGQDASGCFQGTPDYNLFGAAGGDGGRGGNGGDGGNGGTITAYYSDINALSSVLIQGAPGRGGQSSPWGGRGGRGCYCSIFSWTNTVGDVPQTFNCSNGRDGMQATPGERGRDGSYGSVTLIGQLTRLGPEKPSTYVDMSQMLAGPINLSKNHWENRRGARNLFAPGSNIADSYLFFTGRTDIEYSFDWQASRPVSDFRGWQMLLRLEGNDAKLYLPDGLWVDGEKIVNGNQQTYVFKSAVSTGELGNLQFQSLDGLGTEHVVAVKDNAGVSDVLRTTVKMKFWSVENGQYRVRFDGDVPASALSTSANGFKIAMGTLGLNPEWLKRGTQAYVDLTVTRALGSKSAAYTLATYYTLTFRPAVGMEVQAANDANLYSGSSVVGRVTRGDRFKVAAIQNNWVSLKKPDDTPVQGWIDASNLEAVQ